MLSPHSFTCSFPVFPAPLIKERFFSPLHIFAFFVIDESTIGALVYFWAPCSIPLIYMPVFLPVPCCFDFCSSGIV